MTLCDIKNEVQHGLVAVVFTSQLPRGSEVETFSGSMVELIGDVEPYP